MTWLHKFAEHKETLRKLVQQFHPNLGPAPKLPITSLRAEYARIAALRLWPMMSNPMEAFDSNDPKLIHQVLNDTWMGMPESKDVRSVEGFGILCELATKAP